LEIVRLLHSWGRWVVLALLVLALLKFVLGLVQKKPFDKTSETLMKVFSAVFGVQFLLGLGMLATLGFERYRMEHGFAMLVAVALAGLLPRRWRALPDAKRHRNHLLLMLLILALIAVAILRLPAEIQWRFLT